ncbi:signal peptidase I [Oscillatoria sp. FACHB-1407]|uniref:signal peptidase I n=1 Tax=Oscillatoria sp. FACHB-1407 TaxID=2692847 RepID=UPI00168867F8|nr:signal peptidase I [Oscillatoria sp. FACHB-1407]MBD2460180.1 signal peptidase I [Oscillatoria sp. FACHB-1407]
MLTQKRPRHLLAGILVAIGTLTACSPAYKAFYIPSESMTPTLQVNDRIVAHLNAYQSELPQRGDIIIFKPTDDIVQLAPNLDPETVLVKRVVALPGETIEVKDGAVHINNQPLQESYIVEPPEYTWGPIMVPANSYVVFGDNRNNAFDSHYWGFVPQENIVGKVTRRFWPPSRMGAIK